jgi:hypothetical protein
MPLDEPIDTDDGSAAAAVASVTWTGGTIASGARPPRCGHHAEGHDEPRPNGRRRAGIAAAPTT